jgi:hypothetical protein
MILSLSWASSILTAKQKTNDVKSPGDRKKQIIQSYWLKIKANCHFYFSVWSLSLSIPHTLNSSPLFIKGGLGLAAIMAQLNDDEARRVLDAWPDDTDLPASVLAALREWRSESLTAIDPAVEILNADPARAFSTPRNNFLKERRCRTLVAHGVPTNGGATPSPAELRSMIPADDTRSTDSRSDSGSQQSSSNMEEKFEALEAKLLAAQSTIDMLVKQRDEVEGADVSADYVVHSTVLDLVPKSFVSHDPLSKKERLKLSRSHQGDFPEDAWPNRLVLSDATKNAKEIKAAQKLTLTQFADTVGKFMDRNEYATKMAGTSWSRLIDCIEHLQEQLSENPDIVFRAADFIDQLEPIAATTRAAFELGLDSATHMRMNVSRRVDQAMGIDHLRADPTKRAVDDFISPETYKLVEEAAKQKQNLTWAKQGYFPGQHVGRFSGGPPPKSGGGGGNYTKRSKGGGGGKGSGGRGRGKGKGGKDKKSGGRGQGSSGGD